MAAMCGWLSDGEDLGLALKAGEPLGIGGEGVGQDLQRDIAIELRVARTIDLAHPTRANGSQNLVGAKFLARGQRHYRGGAALVAGLANLASSICALSSTFVTRSVASGANSVRGFDGVM